MIPWPQTMLIPDGAPKSVAAASYLESLVDEQAGEGWEFCRVDTIGVQAQPGRVKGVRMALSGQSAIKESDYVATFRKDA